MANKNSSTDMNESKRDKERLQPDEATINLPDVKDIPGQENVHVPKLREMEDTTISSDDEEGVGIWDNETSNQDLPDELLVPPEQIDERRLRGTVRKLQANPNEEEIADEKNPDAVELTSDSMDPASDVTPDEIEALERSENMDTPDNENLFRAELDDTDFDGEKLNEDIEVTGRDLDIPGAELDDDNEDIGEEDEENNAYSLGDNE